MPEMSWERSAEARAALTAIVSDPEYGTAALSSPRTMSNLLKDLLPDAPREKTVLVAAAEAGLAETLRDHVAQGVDSDTAVKLTASVFAANTSFTPEACSWVAGEFAVALGISEGVAASPVVSPGPAQGPPAPTQFAPGPVASPLGPAQYPPGPAQYPPGPAQYPPGPAQYPPGPAQSPPGLAQSPPAPTQGPPGQAQFAPGLPRYSPGPVVSPSGPAQFGPGPAQFSPRGPGYSPTFGMPRPKNNNLAVAALICGIGQFVLWFALAVPGLIAAILALIFGLRSIRQMKVTGESGHGMAVTGIVLGALGILGGLILVILIVIGATVGKHAHQ